MLVNSCCCGRSLKTGATIVCIFYLVVSVCFLIFCIVDVTSSRKGDEGSLLESSTIFKSLKKSIQDRLTVLSAKEKAEVYKSIQHPILELEEATSVKADVSALSIARLIITVFHVISNLALLAGVWKGNGNLVFTWLWTQIVLFIVTCGLAAVLVLVCISKLNILGECLLATCIALYFGISAYCFVVVNSFYHTLYEPYTQMKEDYDKSTLQLV